MQTLAKHFPTHEQKNSLRWTITLPKNDLHIKKKNLKCVTLSWRSKKISSVKFKPRIVHNLNRFDIVNITGTNDYLFLISYFYNDYLSKISGLINADISSYKIITLNKSNTFKNKNSYIGNFYVL